MPTATLTNSCLRVCTDDHPALVWVPSDWPALPPTLCPYCAVYKLVKGETRTREVSVND